MLSYSCLIQDCSCSTILGFHCCILHFMMVYSLFSCLNQLVVNLKVCMNTAHYHEKDHLSYSITFTHISILKHEWVSWDRFIMLNITFWRFIELYVAHICRFLLKLQGCTASLCLKRASVSSWWRSWSTLSSHQPLKEDPTPWTIMG